MLVAQISRGIAPVKAIVEAQHQAHRRGWWYSPILGLPLVEAKNAAVDVAFQYESDLLLIEDDILAGDDVWIAAETLSIHQVGYARTRARDGLDNVYFTETGEFLYTGNVFTVIPRLVMLRLPSPIFESAKFKPLGEHGELVKTSTANDGFGSDVYFWLAVQKLGIEVVELGRVRHLRHALNERGSHVDPCDLSEW
jgi:hypothetical protein